VTSRKAPLLFFEDTFLDRGRFGEESDFASLIHVTYLKQEKLLLNEARISKAFFT